MAFKREISSSYLDYIWMVLIVIVASFASKLSTPLSQKCRQRNTKIMVPVSQDPNSLNIRSGDVSIA